VATNAKSGTFVAADPTTLTPSEAFVSDYGDRLRTLLAEGRARGLAVDDLRALCVRLTEEFPTEETKR